MSQIVPRFVLGCSVLAVLGLVPSAHADDKVDQKAACVAAYEDAQTFRSKSALRDSHEKLLICAAQSCPQVVAEQCAGWLEEVEKALPSVNFAVTDEQGKDLVDVRVSFDGVLLKDHLDGKAVPVDPGSHTFKVESRTRKPLELQVVVREGEKNRQIDMTWKGVAPIEKVPQLPPTEAPHPGAKLSPAFWVLGGAGVLGLGLFATFGGLGLSQKSSDAGVGGCAPKCSASEVSSIKTKFIAADVSLTIGLASLAGAAVVGIVSIASNKPSAPAPAKSGGTVSITAAPAPGGGYVGLEGRF